MGVFSIIFFPFSDILKNYLKDKNLTEYNSQDLFLRTTAPRGWFLSKLKPARNLKNLYRHS